MSVSFKWLTKRVAQTILSSGSRSDKRLAMRLWTYQGHEFDLCRDRLIPEKSFFYQDYPEAYLRLHRELNTDQFVWCTTTAEPGGWRGREECELEVPCSEIFRVINDLLWNVIIGKNACPQALRTQLEEKISRTISVPENWDSLIDQKVEKLRNPEGGPWNNLFLDDPRDVRATILLECPISFEWVVRRKPISL